MSNAAEQGIASGAYQCPPTLQQYVSAWVAKTRRAGGLNAAVFPRPPNAPNSSSIDTKRNAVASTAATAQKEAQLETTVVSSAQGGKKKRRRAETAPIRRQSPLEMIFDLSGGGASSLSSPSSSSLLNRRASFNNGRRHQPAAPPPLPPGQKGTAILYHSKVTRHRRHAPQAAYDSLANIFAARRVLLDALMDEVTAELRRCGGMSIGGAIGGHAAASSPDAAAATPGLREAFPYLSALFANDASLYAVSHGGGVGVGHGDAAPLRSPLASSSFSPSAVLAPSDLTLGTAADAATHHTATASPPPSIRFTADAATHQQLLSTLLWHLRRARDTILSHQEASVRRCIRLVDGDDVEFERPERVERTWEHLLACGLPQRCGLKCFAPEEDPAVAFALEEEWAAEEAKRRAEAEAEEAMLAAAMAAAFDEEEEGEGGGGDGDNANTATTALSTSTTAAAVVVPPPPPPRPLLLLASPPQHTFRLQPAKTKTLSLVHDRDHIEMVDDSAVAVARARMAAAMEVDRTVAAAEARIRELLLCDADDTAEGISDFIFRKFVSPAAAAGAPSPQTNNNAMTLSSSPLSSAAAAATASSHATVLTSLRPSAIYALRAELADFYRRVLFDAADAVAREMAPTDGSGIIGGLVADANNSNNNSNGERKRRGGDNNNAASAASSAAALAPDMQPFGVTIGQDLYASEGTAQAARLAAGGVVHLTLEVCKPDSEAEAALDKKGAADGDDDEEEAGGGSNRNKKKKNKKGGEEKGANNTNLGIIAGAPSDLRTVQNGFALVRPPGHHSGTERASGFCFFNNVAVAARAAQAQYPNRIRRVLIIDWDVHHGDGTEQIFSDDPSVMCFSVHQYGAKLGHVVRHRSSVAAQLAKRRASAAAAAKSKAAVLGALAEAEGEGSGVGGGEVLRAHAARLLSEAVMARHLSSPPMTPGDPPQHHHHHHHQASSPLEHVAAAVPSPEQNNNSTNTNNTAIAAENAEGPVHVVTQIRRKRGPRTEGATEGGAAAAAADSIFSAIMSKMGAEDCAPTTAAKTEETAAVVVAKEEKPDAVNGVDTATTEVAFAIPSHPTDAPPPSIPIAAPAGDATATAPAAAASPLTFAEEMAAVAASGRRTRPRAVVAEAEAGAPATEEKKNEKAAEEDRLLAYFGAAQQNQTNNDDGQGRNKSKKRKNDEDTDDDDDEAEGSRSDLASSSESSSSDDDDASDTTSSADASSSNGSSDGIDDLLRNGGAGPTAAAAAAGALLSPDAAAPPPLNIGLGQTHLHRRAATGAGTAMSGESTPLYINNNNSPSFAAPTRVRLADRRAPAINHSGWVSNTEDFDDGAYQGLGTHGVDGAGGGGRIRSLNGGKSGGVGGLSTQSLPFNGNRNAAPLPGDGSGCGSNASEEDDRRTFNDSRAPSLDSLPSSLFLFENNENDAVDGDAEGLKSPALSPKGAAATPIAKKKGSGGGAGGGNSSKRKSKKEAAVAAETEGGREEVFSVGGARLRINPKYDGLLAPRLTAAAPSPPRRGGGGSSSPRRGPAITVNESALNLNMAAQFGVGGGVEGGQLKFEGEGEGEKERVAEKEKENAVTTASAAAVASIADRLPRRVENMHPSLWRFAQRREKLDAFYPGTGAIDDVGHDAPSGRWLAAKPSKASKPPKTNAPRQMDGPSSSSPLRPNKRQRDDGLVDSDAEGENEANNNDCDSDAEAADDHHDDLPAAGGRTVNAPWPCHGFGDIEYLQLFNSLLLPMMDEFKPDLVIVACGFDSASGDNLGAMQMSPSGYYYLTRLLMKHFEARRQAWEDEQQRVREEEEEEEETKESDVKTSAKNTKNSNISSDNSLPPVPRLVVALEGGYSLRNVALGSEAVLRALMEESSDGARIAAGEAE